MFDFIGYLYQMHKTSRFLRPFGLQHLLLPLPFGFIFARAQTKPAVPAALTFAQWQLGVFFSAFPEKTALPPLPPAPLQIGSRTAVLDAFYTIAKKTNQFALAESFERFLRTDKRLEAADLERFRDSFCDDDRFFIAEPNWIKTTPETLVLEELPSLTPVSDLSECAGVLTTMIFRDGFFVLPFAENFGRAENGRLCLTKAPITIRLTPPERRFINAFYPAFLRRDDQAAAKACLTAGFLPPFFSPLRVQDLLKSAEDLLSDMTKAGIDVPLSLRFVFQTFSKIPPAEAEMTLYAGRCFAHEQFAEEIQAVLKMPPTVAETFAFRRKKPAAFVTDASKVPDVLKRREYAEQFRPKKHTLFSAMVWISAAVIALYLLGLI